MITTSFVRSRRQATDGDGWAADHHEIRSQAQHVVVYPSPEAVPLHVEALIARLNLQVPQAQVDLSALRTLRSQVPTDQFEAAALSVVDSGTLDELRSLLDSAADDSADDSDTSD